MQKILLLIGLSLCLTFSLFAQQSIQFEYGISKGTQKGAGSLSLSWYRNDALKSGHVIRMNYDKSVSDNIQEIKSRSLQFDVAKRWHSSLDRKVKLYLEGGITGMILNSQNQEDRFLTYEYFYTTEGGGCIFCLINNDSSLPTDDYHTFTEENSLLLYDRKDETYALNIMPGVSLGGGLDINLTKSFYMGLHYRMNGYYWLGENEVLYYLRYGLNAGFLF